MVDKTVIETDHQIYDVIVMLYICNYNVMATNNKIEKTNGYKRFIIEKMKILEIPYYTISCLYHSKVDRI